MKQYLTIRNYHEEEIGLVYRWTEELIEYNHYYKQATSWRQATRTGEEIMEEFTTQDCYECIWYTEEEFKALLLMEELIS